MDINLSHNNGNGSDAASTPAGGIPHTENPDIINDQGAPQQQRANQPLKPIT